MQVKICYLPEYTRKLLALKDDILSLQDRFEASAPLEEAEELSRVLGELKLVIDNLPLD